MGESGRVGRLGFLLVGAIGDLLLVARALQDGRMELGSRWNEVEGRRRREGWIYRDCQGFSARFQINLNGSVGGSVDTTFKEFGSAKIPQKLDRPTLPLLNFGFKFQP